MKRDSCKRPSSWKTYLFSQIAFIGLLVITVRWSHVNEPGWLAIMALLSGIFTAYLHIVLWNNAFPNMRIGGNKW